MIEGKGSVSAQGADLKSCKADCSARVVAESEVTLNATPDAGQRFEGWDGTDVACPGTGSCKLRITSATTVQARFGPLSEAPLQLTVTGPGVVKSTPAGIDCGADCNESFKPGTNVVLTAAPADGALFVGWSGACSGAAVSCTVAMNTVASVRASFMLMTACAGLYTGDFELAKGMTPDSIAPAPKPAKGFAKVEPAYKTCLVRATDHAVEPPTGFARNDYSRRQAFNADGSRFIVYALDGTWHMYDARTLAHLRQLVGPAGDAEPQWHATNPDLLYYLPPNGVGMDVMELNVSTEQSRTIGSLGARLKARWPSATTAWTRSEGSPSADGRYWCLMVEGAGFSSLGIVTWDRDTDTITGALSTNGNRPDHVSMSPSGNYCVISSDDTGTVAYSRDFGSQRQVHHKSEHSDIAIDANGDDAYVSIDYQSNDGEVFMVNLRTGVRTVLFPTYLSGSATAMHISGKAFSRPGWVLVSTYGESGATQWMHRKVFVLQLKASPTIYSLAHHHSKVNGYWTEPQASVNRDFTKVLFNSNWETGSSEDVDAYLVELPPGAVR